MSVRAKHRNRLRQNSQPQAALAGSGWSFTGSQDLYPSSQDTTQRGWRPTLDRDAWQMISQSRHRNMVSDGRYIYAGSGMVAGAVRKKADYAVGWSWQPIYKGTNKAFRDAAQPIIDRWTRLCDVRGGVFDWRMGLRLASIALDRDGDVFAILTNADSGGPRLQWIEAHRIGTPASDGFGADTIVPNEPGTQGYAGMTILSGIIYDGKMSPVGYNLLQSERVIGQKEAYNILPASSVVHFFDPDWSSQSRGVPSIARAILDWYDIGETREAEKTAVKANSKIAIIEKNETGRREIGREAIGAQAPGRGGVQTQLLESGIIRYIKSSGDISAHESNRPGPAWQGFMDYVTRGAFAGMDMPYEFAWDSQKIGGAGVRSMVGQVQRAIENRQAVMHVPAYGIVLYAVANYMQRKAIPFSPDWWNWDFSMPAKFSVDIGRDSQNRREDFSVGTRTLSDIVGEDGRSTREHLEERAADYMMAKEVAERTGAPIEWIINPAGSAVDPNEKVAQAVIDAQNQNQT